jgi:MFS transporter, PAT family, beta-lactamase induction signal transducer AmpG
MIGGQGGLVVLAGLLTERFGDAAEAWAVVLAVMAAGFGLLAVWHLWALPRPAADRPAPRAADSAGFFADFGAVFTAFFRTPEVWRVLLFLLFYRFAEAQLLKLVTPFLLDPVEAGGLGLRTQDVGVAYGTFGILSLTVGGLLGGWLISRFGLQRLLWPLVLAMNVPNTVYVLLAAWQPAGLGWVTAAIMVEQFGYGLGFTAFMVYMLMIAGSPNGTSVHKTAHYALCTGFMALGMMLPGMASGWLQEQLGYFNFFVWCCIATLPSFVAAALIRIEPDFGMKDESEASGGAAAAGREQRA